LTDAQAPFHAHIYYDAASRAAAERLRSELQAQMGQGDLADLLLVGPMVDRPVGPHPVPQYEIHFHGAALPAVLARLKASGLRALVHELTQDDLADHTTLAQWIGEPLALDLTVLDPPGMNKGFDRFGKTDF